MRPLLCLLSFCGCWSSDPEGGGLRAVLADGDYRNESFVRINRAPFTSAVHAGDEINVYVSAAGADVYRSVTPDGTQAPPPLPEGTLLVREMLGAGLAASYLTVMEKREAGYFSGGGDFLYAVTDLDGSPLKAADGSLEWGPLAACGSCHAGRSSEGWLFGVRQSAR